MADPQEIGRAFGPYIAIEEYENILALRRKSKAPLFLLRNLSYSAANQEREERASQGNALVSLQLQCMNLPPKYKLPISVIVAVCTVHIGPDGRERMIPIAAKVGRVPLPIKDAAQGARQPSCTLGIRMSLPDGVLTRDVVVLVLHKRDIGISRLLRNMLKAKHRGPLWSPKERQITCNIDDNRIFQWFSGGTKVLYGSVSPDEEMASVDGIGTSKRGILELQPGILDIHSAAEDAASFSVRVGAVGEPTPMLRYILKLEEAPRLRKRKREIIGGGLSTSYAITMAKKLPVTSAAALPMVSAAGNFIPPSTISIVFCSHDGGLRVISRLRNPLTCPFEPCSLHCRHSLTALHQHFVSTHPYYEYSLTLGDEGPEIWIRPKKEYFASDGSFLPMLTYLPPSLGESHPMSKLLFRSAIKLPFMYHCTPDQRRMRYLEGGKPPIDHREAEYEARAAEVANWIWDRAVLEPTESELAKAKEAAASEDVGTWSDIEESIGGVSQGLGRQGSRQRHRGAEAQPPAPVKLPLEIKKGKYKLPKFYHSRTCVAMTEKELENKEDDSDDDDDTEQYLRHCRTALEEKSILCPEEREFMLTWNLYTHENPIQGDYEVPKAVIAFAKQHAEKMADGASPFRRCFVAHVMNFWKFRLLTPSQLHAALSAVPCKQQMAAGETAAAEAVAA